MLEYLLGPLSSETNVVMLLAAVFLGTFASEDLACLFAGTLVTSGRVSFLEAAGTCFLGILVGDILLYGAGRLLGRRLLNLKITSRLIKPEQLKTASRWLDRNGAAAVFFSRFVSGLRLPTYFAAGVLRTDSLRFIFYFALAALIWTPLLVGASSIFQSTLSGSYLFVVVSAVVLVRILLKLTDWRTRRLLYGKARRVLDWEFWPVQIFYLPVFIYILLLATRFRSLTVFTAANPAITSGGFVGESKDDIYRTIKGPGAERFLLKHQLICGRLTDREKIESALGFISRFRLTFPLAVKPDAGERGKGVAIVRSFEDLCKLLNTSDDLLIQEFCSGVEVSIFYHRLPHEKRGNIFSITEKRFPQVTGDGISTLESLILKDDRAVCMAKSHFSHNAGRLNTTPAQGKKLTLIDIGTHSRGCIFLDGEWLKTPELVSSIDRLCRNIEGFYFGRFDIRASSFDDIIRGENFKIVELNGVSSESTNIYDPNFNLIDAYRILFRQWKIAFEIGAANTKMGTKPLSISELLSLVLSQKSNNFSGKSSSRSPIECA